MVDVLLTHSYHMPYDRKQARKMQPYPPLGTLYAAAVLRQRGFSVALFDTMLRDPEEFSEALRLHKPRIVAVYEDDFNFLSKMCLTRMRQIAFTMAEQSRDFGARTIAHGSDATDHAAEFLTSGFEYVLIGEAEYPLSELCSAMLCGGTETAVPGVAYRRGTFVTRSAKATVLSYKQALPSPARDLIDVQLYRDAWIRKHGYFSLNAIASRGCPFRCNWCAKPIFGDRFRVSPASEIASEMHALKDTYGAEHIWFADDIFGLDRHWVQNFANEVARRRAQVPFKIQARADLLTRETVAALARAGCHEIWMGVESGSQKILDAMEKGLKVQDVVAARDHLKAAAIRACYFLQFGYLGETWEDIRHTISFVRQTRPDDIGVSLSYPLPNTRFFQQVREQMGTKRNWSDSEDLCVVFKGAYTDEFYRSIRDALHLEVDSWREGDELNQVGRAWDAIETAERFSRNPDATVLPMRNEHSSFVPMRQLSLGVGD